MAEEQTPNRIYVGNISFQTTEDELKSLFGPDEVESISIPTRSHFGHQRKLGYAFATFKTKEAASKAVEQHNGTELGGRQLNIAEAKSEGPFASSSSNSKQDSTNSTTKNNVNNSESSTGGEKKTNGHAKKPRNKSKVAATVEGAVDAVQTKTEEVKEDVKDATSSNKNKGATRKRFQPKRKNGELPPGTESPTTLFVYNLPFTYTDEDLGELFKKYAPVSSRVALRVIPVRLAKKLSERGEKRKCRGYGFVEVADQDTQAKVVEEMNGVEVDGRNIIVRVAIDKPGKGIDEAAEEEAPKEAETVDATA